ncbi:cuticle protein, putative [Ixodes scapularis]|uniref:Cuticle protein, putative n=1 Tax=Ixodes scapularis TaxID=6945 RepID=B7PA51_IXOSC|nr:cuticle protein, putative [Ixodes scapularis]|eukprot:XP_002406236.1 cuticle protein, putative [Ixodes scapularis]
MRSDSRSVNTRPTGISPPDEEIKSRDKGASKPRRAVGIRSEFAAVLLLAVAVSAVPLKFNPQGDLDTAAQTFHAVHAADDFSQPTPYSYKHETTGEDGAVTVHEESGDGQGRVSGSYSFSLPDGRQRTVRYTADETGFHPELTTNEQGTESNSPADSSFSSSALPGPDAAHAAEPERLRQLGAGGFKSKA